MWTFQRDAARHLVEGVDPYAVDNLNIYPPDEVTRTLANLADLRDRGAITPEEYEHKKADLLSRL